MKNIPLKGTKHEHRYTTIYRECPPPQVSDLILLTITNATVRFSSIILDSKITFQISDIYTPFHLSAYILTLLLQSNLSYQNPLLQKKDGLIRKLPCNITGGGGGRNAWLAIDNFDPPPSSCV